MSQKLSDQEFHALYCPVKNKKSALFLVVSFSVVAFVGWEGLHKVPASPSFVELLFAILVVAILAKWLVAFTCFRERWVLIELSKASLRYAVACSTTKFRVNS